MPFVSPFESMMRLPALAPFLSAGASRTHAVVHGLIGSSRSLAAASIGLSRENAGRKSKEKTHRTRIVLIVVDGPETALDTVADMRAFLACEEAVQAALKPRAKPLTDEERYLKNLNNDEKWADVERPATDSMPEHLKTGLRLETALFPAWDVLPTESDRPEGMTLAGRRKATERLSEIKEGRNAPPQCFVLLAPIAALQQPCESPADTGRKIVLRSGDEHDPIKLGRLLAESGYDRVGQVEVRGEYALRGGILDIFPYTSDTPYRVDFFGETIESIKPFDPISQRAEEEVECIEFADASPNVLRKLFSPGAGAGPYSLFDHLPDGSLIVFEEPGKLRQRADLYQASLISGNSICFEIGELLNTCLKRFDTLQLVGEWDGGKKKAEDAEASDGEPDPEKPADSALETFAHLADDAREFHVECKTLQRLEGDIPEHADAWKKIAAERERVVVFCETGGHKHRLQTLFDESKITPVSSVQLTNGKLAQGFDLRSAGFACISDREILGTSKQHAGLSQQHKRKQMPGTVAVQHLVDLQLGDYVVHQAHGIARYLGIARLEKSGRTEDYLTLLFNNDVKLYVPAAHIGWVGKYIGGHANLELSTLGSKVWQRKKDRAEKAIRDIAEDLLGVQAARKSLPGIVYPPDGEWQDDFEKAFPYEETPDQDTAIAAVKGDMEGTWPMDRLICGDVGFGKTEVALRAAFKATGAGKQVAILVPTTLLAEQHGKTFTERFAGFPFQVATLSRFRSAKQAKAILEKLALGRVDVIIGTHRLLQKDIRFKDLGLAIIDEEQRFGVEHKEFFKRLRKSVDVLTLTATPIPRTLHMAMLGLRDISNLTTPPRNRLAVTTKVARVSDDLLRRAMLREISRGGQIFVVHPRVRDIEVFRDRLAKLVPEATFSVGHGQMDPDDLEEVMSSFVQGKVDVLVSTTIIESGLDIPSANTIIIHEADRFGLAELHQLRGRVGRGGIQAYCYLLLPENSALTSEGLRRLRALEEFDDLGAGFQLALKDLEIRGAGNVLGSQQSGEIAEIGYDLYCKLLNSTVQALRGEKVPDPIEVTVQLRGAAFIPDDYVQDERAILELYRRLDDAKNGGVIDALKTELLDRFGPPPASVDRMFEEAKVRRMAQIAFVPYIGIENDEGRLVLKLHDWDLKDADRALRGIPETKDVRVLNAQTFTFGLTLRAKHDEKLLRQFVCNLLEPLMWWRQGTHPSQASGGKPTR